MRQSESDVKKQPTVLSHWFDRGEAEYRQGPRRPQPLQDRLWSAVDLCLVDGGQRGAIPHLDLARGDLLAEGRRPTMETQNGPFFFGFGI